MALTRENIETVLVKRCGALLTAAGLNGTTHDGSNADLDDPIAVALLELGITPASITHPVDADCAHVSATDTLKCFDLAEVRTLESILGNLDEVNITVGPRSESLSDLAKQVEQKLARLQAQLLRKYGIGQGTLTAGIITLDFAQKGDDPEITS